jgi:hypothetical protein
MDDTLKILVPSVLAFIGSLAAIIVSYRKWRYEQRSTKLESFEQERRTVYKELWERVEEIHIRLRVGGNLERDDFDKLIQSTNVFMLKNSIYLDDGVHALVNDYLQSNKKLEDCLAQLPGSPSIGDGSGTSMPTESAAREIKKRRHITAISIPVPKELRQVYGAHSQVNELRKRLEGRIRAVLVGAEASGRGRPTESLTIPKSPPTHPHSSRSLARSVTCPRCKVENRDHAKRCMACNEDLTTDAR